MSAKRFVYPAIGSISSGTMRTEDLLDTFTSELRYQMRRMRLTRDQRKRFNALLRDYTELDNDMRSREDDSPTDDDGGELLSDLFDALDEIAPPYCTFGACQDDGADYGWWPSLDSAEEYCTKLNSGDPINREHWGDEVLLVNDHGNVDCGYVDRKGKFHEYWSCV